MIVFDGLKLIGLAVMAVLLVICGIVIVIDRIAYAVKKINKSALTMRSKRRASDD